MQNFIKKELPEKRKFSDFFKKQKCKTAKLSRKNFLFLLETLVNPHFLVHKLITWTNEILPTSSSSGGKGHQSNGGGSSSSCSAKEQTFSCKI